MAEQGHDCEGAAKRGCEKVAIWLSEAVRTQLSESERLRVKGATKGEGEDKIQICQDQGLKNRKYGIYSQGF